MNNIDWDDIFGTIFGVGLFVVLPLFFFVQSVSEANSESASSSSYSESADDTSSDSSADLADDYEADASEDEYSSYDSDYYYDTQPEPEPEYDSSECNPNYSGCVENSYYDLDCADISGGVEVVGHDEYGLDGDGDGYGCEWN